MKRLNLVLGWIVLLTFFTVLASYVSDRWFVRIAIGIAATVAMLLVLRPKWPPGD